MPKRMKQIGAMIALVALFTTVAPVVPKAEAGGYATEKAVEAVLDGIGALVGWIVKGLSSKEEKPKQTPPAKEEDVKPAPAPDTSEPITVNPSQIFDF